ncbi:hypothetical protein L7F22_058756 [Adiantum nelumboides]|nr:hypothetical protein [Adiantum nelumboides]
MKRLYSAEDEATHTSCYKVPRQQQQQQEPSSADYSIHSNEWGEYLPHTLKEAAKKWYYHYPASKLQSYRKLKKAFILEYTDDRGDEDILCELDRIKQGKLSVKKYVQKIKELTRRLNEPPSHKRMRTRFLSGFNSRKLREQEVRAPTKKFTKMVHRALKLDKQAKKEKSRHQSNSESSTSASIESEKSNNSSSYDSEDDKRKKKKGSWSRKLMRCLRRGRDSSGDFKRNFNCYKCGKYGQFAAQCPEPAKPAAPEAKQPKPVSVRAITRNSSVVIEELPKETPVPSKLNPKAKEWKQQRSTSKEKGKAKEFDELCFSRDVHFTRKVPPINHCRACTFGIGSIRRQDEATLLSRRRSNPHKLLQGAQTTTATARTQLCRLQYSFERTLPCPVVRLFLSCTSCFSRASAYSTVPLLAKKFGLQSPTSFWLKSPTSTCPTPASTKLVTVITFDEAYLPSS